MAVTARFIASAGALALLAGCADRTPERLPEAPAGFETAWAFADCAPWDGPATTIYLAGTEPSDVREPPYPHLWVSLYRPASDLNGRVFRWDTGDKNTAGAMWCPVEGGCVAATEGQVRVHEVAADGSRVSGALDLTFPDTTITGGFRAVGIRHEPLCG